jgi:hypothetical protein
MNETGPLTRKVLDYVETMRRLVPTAKTAADWEPLAEFVAADDFERVGTFREVQDWQQYTGLLTQWSSSIGEFETVVRRISELDRLVYYEVEERHQRSDGVHVLNSMTVFAFDVDGKICHLDVYLQQAPPRSAG